MILSFVETCGKLYCDFTAKMRDKYRSDKNNENKNKNKKLKNNIAKFERQFLINSTQILINTDNMSKW